MPTLRHASISIAALLPALALASCSGGPRKLDGHWVGGWNQEQRYHFLELTLLSDSTGQAARMLTPVEPEPKSLMMKITWDDSEFLLSLLRKDEDPVELKGKRDGEFVRGTSKQGMVQGTFELSRIMSVSPEALDRYVGRYAAAGGASAVVRREGGYLVVKIGDGADRAFFPSAEKEFTAGPEGHVPSPVAQKASFNSDGAAPANAMTILDAKSGAAVFEGRRAQ